MGSGVEEPILQLWANVSQSSCHEDCLRGLVDSMVCLIQETS